jgi:hypothetical protein
MIQAARLEVEGRMRLAEGQPRPIRHGEPRDGVAITIHMDREAGHDLSWWIPTTGRKTRWWTDFGGLDRRATSKVLYTQRF